MKLNFKTISKKIAIGFLAVSFATTTLGGAFAATAYAAETPATEQQVQKSDQTTYGLLALGLLALLSKGDKPAASGAPKNTNTTPSTTTPGSGTNTSPNQTSPTKPSSPTTTPSTTTPSTSSVAAAEQKAVALMNADRAANGLPALKVDSRLTALAEAYAKDMINRGYFSHYNPEGQSPFDRMRKAGISYSSAGENLAINQSVEGAEKAFMSSSGHRANILNANYNTVGIGVAYAPNGSVYVVQEFIRQ